jgi:hypothetical protein
VGLLAWALTVLGIPAGVDLGGIALGTGTSVVWLLALRMQAACALGAGMIRLITLPMAQTVAPLLAIEGLAMAGGTPRAATIRRWAA